MKKCKVCSTKYLKNPLIWTQEMCPLCYCNFRVNKYQNGDITMNRCIGEILFALPESLVEIFLQRCEDTKLKLGISEEVMN